MSVTRVARSAVNLAAIVAVAALSVGTPPAIAQDTSTSTTKRHCALMRATRGGSSELVPDDGRTPDQARNFPFAFDDTGLEPEFQVDERRRRNCLAGFGISFGQAAPAAPAAATAGAAAAPGGVAAAGAGIGTITGTVAVGAAIGLAVVAGAVAAAAAAGGGSGPGSTTCTTCD